MVSIDVQHLFSTIMYNTFYIELHGNRMFYSQSIEAKLITLATTNDTWILNVHVHVGILQCILNVHVH